MTSRTIAALGFAACVLAGGACISATPPPDHGGGDAPGGQLCGGLAGIECPPGLECRDDPADACDPNRGGADCGGLCVPSTGSRFQCDGPSRQYASRDPDICTRIRFLCDPGFTTFFDDCGCGCEPHSARPCGEVTCDRGEYCCNLGCGICAPMGATCLGMVCDSIGSGRR